MCYVYILKSLKKDWYYVGVSSDLEKRLKKHNWGHTPSTRKYRPLKLIYQEKFETKKKALQKEMFLKSVDGYQEKQKIIKGLT